MSEQFNQCSGSAEDNEDYSLSEEYEDYDSCSPSDLEQLFKHKYKIHDEPTVAFDNNYALNLAKDDSFTCIAAGLSDGSVRLFEISSERGLYIKSPPTDRQKDWHSICGVRFVDETPNLLLVGTTNGLVRLLDLRTRNEVSRFEKIPANKAEPKRILSFDRNSNSRLLCVGTDQRNNNVDLLFYDLRTPRELFRYLESHSDDITCLRFHPENPNILCSGSTDGLINIFDVRANDANEDEAILSTINVENTIHKVNWHKDFKSQDIISCITHTNDFKSFNSDGDCLEEFRRLQITENIKRKNESNCNLIDCHSTSDNDMLLLTCSNLNNGAILRSCILQNKELLPYANFEGNHQVVRESIYDDKTKVLITAGESGFVTLWTPQTWNTSATNANTLDFNSSSSSSLKMKTKISNKVAPY